MTSEVTSNKAVLIAGPTASGKSALALELAQKTGGMVINTDSMQVYRDLRVLTARPTAEEEAARTHRLYGHVDASINFSAGAWVADAASVLEEARAQNRLPIFAGGSGLYFKALTRGLSAVPPIPPIFARAFARGSIATASRRCMRSLQRLDAVATEPSANAFANIWRDRRDRRKPARQCLEIEPAAAGENRQAGLRARLGKHARGIGDPDARGKIDGRVDMAVEPVRCVRLVLRIGRAVSTRRSR